MAEQIKPGDYMRIAIPLLERIYASDGHLSERVLVKRILVEQDGCKTLILQQVRTDA